MHYHTKKHIFGFLITNYTALYLLECICENQKTQDLFKTYISFILTILIFFPFKIAQTMQIASLISIAFFLVQIVADSQNGSALTSNCSFYFTIEQNASSFRYCKNNQQINESSWGNCQAYCCPSISPSVFSIATLEVCMSGVSVTTKTTDSLVIVIVFVAIITALIILGLVCRSCRNYMNSIELQKIAADLPQHERNNLTVSFKIEKWICKQGKTNKSSTSLTDTIQELNCSICLQAKTNIGLTCTHQFHQNCLSQWFNQKQICPMCRKDVNFVRIKCQQKCGRYMIMKLMDYENSKEEFSRKCGCQTQQKETDKI